MDTKIHRCVAVFFLFIFEKLVYKELNILSKFKGYININSRQMSNVPISQKRINAVAGSLLYILYFVLCPCVFEIELVSIFSVSSCFWMSLLSSLNGRKHLCPLCAWYMIAKLVVRIYFRGVYNGYLCIWCVFIV